MVYTDACLNSWTAHDFADDVEITVIAVSLTPNPVYVYAGGTGLLTATVTPVEAAAQVTFDSSSASIATITGEAPSLIVIGASEGTAQLHANVGQDVVSSVDVHVVSVDFSPTDGPVLTQVVFSSTSVQAPFFSADTTIQINAVFQPQGFEGEYFSLTHETTNVHYDPAKPNEVSIAVADVFPTEFLSSSNPGIAMAIAGTLEGLVTLTNSANTCTVEGSFTITPAFTLGKLNNGQVEELSTYDVWQASSTNDFIELDPDIFLYGQIVRPGNTFTSPPPSTITATIQTFLADGSPCNGSGVSVNFALVSCTSSQCSYQTVKPFVLIENASLEGDQGVVVAIYAEGGGYTQIVRMPP